MPLGDGDQPVDPVNYFHHTVVLAAKIREQMLIKIDNQLVVHLRIIEHIL